MHNPLEISGKFVQVTLGGVWCDAGATTTTEIYFCFSLTSTMSEIIKKREKT